MAFVVKVLSGSHRGAEAALGEGCLIGSGVDCDIILSDDGVAEQHLILDFDGGKVTMTVLAEPVYVDGEAVIAKGRTVLPLQVISLGFAHITFGPEASDWQSLKLPLIRPEEEREEQEEPEGEQDETMDIGEEAAPPPAAASVAAAAGVDNAPGAVPPPQSQHGHGFLWLGAGVSVVLLLAVGYYAFPGVFSTPKKSAQNRAAALAVAEPLTEVRKIISGYQGLKADKLGSVVRVSGFLRHNRDLGNLKEEIRKASLLDRTRFSVVVGDEVVTTLKSSLAAAGMSVEVELEGGTLELFGVVADKKSLRRVLKDSRFRSLTLKDETVTSDELIAYIRKLLGQKHFAGHIDMGTGKDGVLQVAGLVEEKDYTVWQEVEKALAKAYPLLQVDDGVRPIPDQGFAVESVVVGPKSFVTLANGQTIAEGQPLKEGYILDKITAAHLLVGVGSRQYRYVYH